MSVRPDDRQQASGHGDQHVVADIVTEHVVDLLELVEVKKEDRDAAL